MDAFDPFDSKPPGGDGRQLDRLLVWAATAGALGCSVLIFLLTNVSAPEPVAEPAPTTDTAFPLAASSTITTTTTIPPTTTTTTTVVPPATTTAPPTTTTRRTTATTRPPTTTTVPPTTSSPRCAAAAWQRDTAYSGGSVVAYGGVLWMAKWWNYNAEPGANAEGVWVQAQPC